MNGWLSISVAGLLAIGAPGSARAADVEGVIGPVARASEIDGRKIGCDLSFHVGRGPSLGDWREGIGATVTWMAMDGRSAAVMKIGYQPGSRVVIAPTTAFLGDATFNNARELVQQLPSENDGYINLIFAPGEETLSALQTFESTGVMKIGIEKPGGEVVIWGLDLTGHPEVRADWTRCLSTLPLRP